MDRRFVQMAAVLGFFGVALGAFGTHGLRGRVPDTDLTIWTTGVHYQTIHAVVLLVVALLAPHADPKKISAAGWLFVVGVLIFSGSLYALVLTNVRVLGAITPIGGVCLLAGWLLTGLSARRA